LMTQIRSFDKANSVARYGISGELFNAVDGLIWATEGRIIRLAGLRCGPLVVNQTTAVTAPSQQA